MEDSPFDLVANFEPAGDQPEAIESLQRNLEEGKKEQVLLGVTGSGKTYLMAQMIARFGQPAIVMSPNKTLAAQLYTELKAFFPNNAVEYFVSYYDYYQPEAYIPQRDIYIEKDAAINVDLDRLRLAATSSLMSRKDVIIVASVSSIYGLGSPEEYRKKVLKLHVGQEVDRDDALRHLVDVQYQRNDMTPSRGSFRARGDVVELFPADDEIGFRVEWFGDEIERIEEFHSVSGEILREVKELSIFPAKHFVVDDSSVDKAIHSIQEELKLRLAELDGQGKQLESHRLASRTRYDLELMREVGYCPGIENYSRHFTSLKTGERPFNLFDYFPDEFLCIVDESHVAIPQIGAMFAGDRARKQTLVDHGFRLPSALDNRPMTFPEWKSVLDRLMLISATPGPYELELCKGEYVEMIIRPTGLLDPPVSIKPATGQVQDLIDEVRKTIEQGERVLITTLTKRMAEDLCDFFQESDIRTRYLHSEIQTLERVEILQELRKGTYDVLIGVNLLREGLDLPEVSLVAIMDADKEGYLRSETSLVQTIGRAARNANARVILYADRETGSIQRALKETNRRRAIQKAHNEAHGITPRTVIKEFAATVDDEVRAYDAERNSIAKSVPEFERTENLRRLEEEMLQAAKDLDFEKAAALRDQIQSLNGDTPAKSPRKKPKRRRR